MCLVLMWLRNFNLFRFSSYLFIDWSNAMECSIIVSVFVKLFLFSLVQYTKRNNRFQFKWNESRSKRRDRKCGSNLNKSKSEIIVIDSLEYVWFFFFFFWRGTFMNNRKDRYANDFPFISIDHLLLKFFFCVTTFFH